MAFDAFLKIEGIKGECGDTAHKDWIEVLSYNHGMSNSRRSAGDTRHASIEDFSIVKKIDQSTPLLAQYCWQGRAVPKVTMEICEAAKDKHVYMTYELENVVISSVRERANAKGEEPKPLEEVSFNFGKITWRYIPIDSGGRPLPRQEVSINVQMDK